MKNCPKCGVELADDVSFCTECGEKLVEVKAAPEVEAAPATEAAPAAKKNPSVDLILGIVSLVLTFIPFLCYSAPIVAIVGIVFGAKEVKAGGKKTGLILSIIALVIFVLSIIIGFIGGIIIGLLGAADIFGELGGSYYY